MTPAIHTMFRINTINRICSLMQPQSLLPAAQSHPVNYAQITAASFAPIRGLKTQSHTSYYDVLGITPKATQVAVKAAFYGKSKIHHPDVSKSADSKVKFLEILEAYEVLGDKRKRRMYDRGILNPLDPRSGHEASQDVEDFPDDDTYGQRGTFARRRGPIPTGRSRNYNFDEYYKQHYSETMERTRKDKQHDKDIIQDMKDSQSNKQSKHFIVLMAMIVVVAMLITQINKSPVQKFDKN